MPRPSLFDKSTLQRRTAVLDEFPLKKEISKIFNDHGYYNEAIMFWVSRCAPWTHLPGHERYDEILCCVRFLFRLKCDKLDLKFTSRQQSNSTITEGDSIRKVLIESIQKRIKQMLNRWNTSGYSYMETFLKDKETILYPEKAFQRGDLIIGDNSEEQHVSRDHMLFLMDSKMSERSSQWELLPSDELKDIVQETYSHIITHVDDMPIPGSDGFWLWGKREIDKDLLDISQKVFNQDKITAEDLSTREKEFESKYKEKLESITTKLVVDYYKDAVRPKLTKQNARHLFDKEPFRELPYERDSREYRLVSALEQKYDNNAPLSPHTIAHYLYYVISGRMFPKGETVEAPVAELVYDIMNLYGLLHKKKQGEYLPLSTDEKYNRIRYYFKTDRQSGLYSVI